jgi:AcrR family transcriptional regulator
MSQAAGLPEEDAPPRKRERADLKRQRIADAARPVFLTHGLEGAKTRDIAAAAGVTETVLYRHFRSKDEVFEEAVLAPVERLAIELIEIHAQFPKLNADTRFERSEETHRRLAVTVAEISPLLGIALFSNHEAGKRFYQARLAPVFDQLAEAMAAAMPVSAKAIVEPRIFVQLLLGLYFGTTLDHEFRGRVLDTDGVAGDVTRLIAYGAFAKEPRGSGRRRSSAQG